MGLKGLDAKTNWLAVNCQTLTSNEVLRTTGKFPRCIPVRELRVAFKIPYIYDYITKLCKQQAEVIKNNENANVGDIGNGEARHRKYIRLKFGGFRAYDRSND
jgi:hypothetical protein